jgi:hypothetical protein
MVTIFADTVSPDLRSTNDTFPRQRSSTRPICSKIYSVVDRRWPIGTGAVHSDTGALATSWETGTT